MTGDLLLCHSLAFEKYVSSKQTDPRSVGMTSKVWDGSGSRLELILRASIFLH